MNELPPINAPYHAGNVRVESIKAKPRWRWWKPWTWKRLGQWDVITTFKVKPGEAE